MFFFANKVVERCLRDGTTKCRSSERQYFLNEGDSTIESGSMLSATRQIKASKARHCQESFGAYFLPEIKESTVVCSPVTFALVPDFCASSYIFGCFLYSRNDIYTMKIGQLAFLTLRCVVKLDEDLLEADIQELQYLHFALYTTLALPLTSLK